jgi:hypothetical protein
VALLEGDGVIMGQEWDEVGVASRHLPTSVSAGSTDLDDLLSSIRRGDLVALATLYDHTAPMIFGLLHVALPEPSDAEQATQRCYLWLWRAAPNLSSDRLCAIALLLSAAEHELASCTDRTGWSSG